MFVFLSIDFQISQSHFSETLPFLVFHLTISLIESISFFRRVRRSQKTVEICIIYDVYHRFNGWYTFKKRSYKKEENNKIGRQNHIQRYRFVHLCPKNVRNGFASIGFDLIKALILSSMLGISLSLFKIFN